MIIIILFFLVIKENKKIENFTYKTPFPIDIVYTWAGEINNTNDPRLSNNNELKYSLRSVMKYASWVNKIYILMNPPKKKPSWFNNEYSKKIILVDHNDTFTNKKYLPCTNSNSIETTLINIKGLSEHFIYFNDDFYLGNYTSYLNFFNKDGSKIIIDKNLISRCTSMNNNQNNNININLPYYCGIARHIPLAFKKSIIKKFQNKYKDYIKFVRNIKSRVGTGMNECSKNNLPKWCQQQYGPIAKFAYDNNYVILHEYASNEAKYISYYYKRNLDNLLKNIILLKPKFFCINDVKINNNLERIKYYNKINKFLNDYYPNKPFFEK